jgi:hypothetical protein
LQFRELAAQLGFALVEFELLLALPEAGGPNVAVELGQPGVEMGFAFFDFAEASLQMSGQVGGLLLHLFFAAGERLPQHGGG